MLERWSQAEAEHLHGFHSLEKNEVHWKVKYLEVGKTSTEIPRKSKWNRK
jgi:hypothetical protein